MKKVLMKQRYYPMFPSVFIVMVLLLITFLNPSYAQGPVEELSGWFSIDWGDSEDGNSSTVYTLSDLNGQETMLNLDEKVVKNLGGVLQFNGKHVSAQGTLATPSGTNMKSDSVEGSQAAFNVISISSAPLFEPQALAIDGVSSAAVSGAFPWVTIMCKFSDIADEPNNVAYFNGMYSSTKPGMDHYWKELSFNQVDVSGSSVGGTGWYTLPNTELYYNPTDTQGGTDKTLLANECLAAADADVDYSLYDGINMMFNSNFDNGYAWGGSRYMTLDGVTKRWRTTWEPPWAYHNISVIAHEMGHGFGLPHSDAPGGVNTYDNPWDVMSQDRYNCGAAWDPTYGCMAQHTISYHKDLLGWIPGVRIITVSSGTDTTVILEDLAAPASSNYQMVKITTGETPNFYTVEARKFTGYDVKLPDEGIVIHNVDTSRSADAVLEPDGSSTNLWSVGETFIDAANDISVTVNADTGTGFEVTISNFSNIIDGTIFGEVQGGVTIELYKAQCGGNELEETVTTDLNGDFIFTGVLNGSYFVEPEKTGYTFSPEGQFVTISDNSVSGVDFTATTRFVDNGDGTVTDTLTLLMWLQDGSCFGTQDWDTAATSAEELNSGECGLSDGSAAGDWRLPTREEFQGIGTDPPTTYSPAFPSAAWTMPSAPFIAVSTSRYWSITKKTTDSSWYVRMLNGGTNYSDLSTSYYVWPVR